MYLEQLFLTRYFHFKTFQIFALCSDGVNENLLIKELGRSLTELLFDLLNFPEGIRLRDRISHGEYDFNDIDERIANYVLCTGICLCLKYLFPWRKSFAVDSSLLKRLDEKNTSYQSIYHPISMLIRDVTHCLERIETLSTARMKIEIDQEVEDYRTTEETTNKKINKNLVTECADISSLYMASVMLSTEKNIPESSTAQDVIRSFINVIMRQSREFLFRPKDELEIQRILRKIVSQCTIIAQQV